MANYECAWRTNYFHVKNPVLFLRAMNIAKASSEDLEIFDNNEGVFGIGGYGLYTYCLDNLDREQYKEGLEVARELGVDKDTYDSGEGFLLEILQKCVADDDAIIFIEGGHEKLNYVAGSGTIITSKQIEYVDLLGVVLRKADEILGNPDWHKNTRVDY